MAWLSRNNFTPTDKLHADDLNNLANDIRTWGGDVNGGGYTLSNVRLVGVLPLAGAAVTSVFGRTGDVVAVATDYTPAFIGAVPTARLVIAGPGLSGGGPLSADVTLNALVTSVFGRTGAVTLTPTDISGATGVLNTRQILTPGGGGLSGGGNLSADLSLAVVPDSVNQRVQVYSASGASPVGTRRAINFINGSNIAVTVADNPTNNRVDITVASTAPPSLSDPTTTQGDLIVRGLTALGRLPVGTTGQILTVDTTQPLSVKWVTAAAGGGGAVTSVFGRTGDVVAANNDYLASQVKNAVDQTVSYPNPAWITSLGWNKIINAPNFMVDQLTTKGDMPVHSATATTRLPVGSDGTVLIADSAQTLGVRWGSVAVGGSQSPWTTNIDAASFNLNNVNAVGVSMASNATLARISVKTSATGEDGIRITGLAAGFADVALYNDLGVQLQMVAWGST